MPNTMESYANRLSSFLAGHPATKKRASDPKGTRKLKWPHQNPSPEQMAHAGFYYNPTSSNPDNVTCYLCKSNLDGWEETDNAIEEHISHCQDCGWAINVWIEQSIERGLNDLENPLSEKMLEARKMTFSTGWPHEDKRGWLCKTQKMSEAGWHYAPTPESDDFVKCSYCSLSLDGWEPKDKPYQEHERRSPECLFFKLAGPVKPKAAGRSKKERASKASRLSTQSNITIASEAPSFADVEIGGDESLLSTANSMNSKPAKKAKGSKTSKKAVGSKKSAVKVAEEPTLASSYMEPEDDDFSVKVDVSPEPKARGKKRPSHQISRDEDDGLLHENGDEKPPPAKRRATRTRNSVLQTQIPLSAVSDESKDVQMDDVDSTTLKASAAPASKKGRKGGKKQGSTKSRKTSNMSTASKASLRTAIPEDDDLDAALALDLERPLTDDEEDVEQLQARESKGRRLTKTKPVKASVAPTRRTTRASTAPVDVSILVPSEGKQQAVDTREPDVEDGVETSQHLDSQKPQSKKPKKAKQQKATKNEELHAAQEDISDDELTSAVSIQVSKGTAVKKAARGRQASRQKPTSSLTESSSIDTGAVTVPEVDAVVDQTLMDDSGHETDASVATQSRATHKKPAAKKGRKGKKSQVPHQNLEDIVHTDSIKDNSPNLEKHDIDSQANLPDPASIVQAGKSKSAAKPSTKSRKGKKAAKLSSPPPQVAEEAPASPREPKELTPVPSPQSSDAENHPPSSRPSATRPPLSSVSSPPLQATRIPLADVTPVKSPSKHTFSKLQTAIPWTSVDLELIFQATPIEDKENAGLNLNIQNATNVMSSPEKKMSVEQWIHFCAQRGEERLRTDCERIVGRFESEGMRALNTLEGIVCNE